MSLILGIDPGAKCGIAIASFGQIDVARSRVHHLANATPGARFLELLRILVAYRPTAIFYEQSAPTRGHSAIRALAGYCAIIQLYAARHDIPCTGVHFAAVKKRATGKGNAKKDAMVRAACAEWGVTNEDLADALWILQVGLDSLRL